MKRVIKCVFQCICPDNISAYICRDSRLYKAKARTHALQSILVFLDIKSLTMRKPFHPSLFWVSCQDNWLILNFQWKFLHGK